MNLFDHYRILFHNIPLMHFYVYVLKETFSLLNMYIDIPIQYLFSRHFLIHFIFKKLYLNLQLFWSNKTNTTYIDELDNLSLIISYI